MIIENEMKIEREPRRGEISCVALIFVGRFFCVRDSSGKPTAQNEIYFGIRIARTWNG